MFRSMLAACVLVTAIAPGATPARAETVALATSVPDTGTNKLFVDTFIEELKKSAPDLEVERFMDSQLGNERELIDLIKLGEIEFFIGSIHSAQYYPELDATAVPYLFENWAEVKAFLDGPIGERMSEALQQRGNAVPLAYYYQGARWATTQGRPFRTVADLKGLKMRMSEIPLWIDIWSGLGATIAPMPSNEVFSAMQTGVIDAQENMLANIYGRQIHTVSDYLINTQHLQSYMTLMVNKDFWDGLGEDEQSAVKAAAVKAGEVTDAAAEEVVKEIVSDIAATGVEVVEVDPSFRKDAMPVVEKAAQSLLADGVWEAAVAAGSNGSAD
ncbi:TRAP transporter substrate-binding protein [Acuticoccus sediminis]|uniref:TRAP transporter substrate-binding protein n=1 Tax=Acuticoccus sediminis TaxID=2184697 RepID=UPI001CFDC97F|nr:TRAP transporter substrate-binding protein [Acuticoccus sediminis]